MKALNPIVPLVRTSDMGVPPRTRVDSLTEPLDPVRTLLPGENPGHQGEEGSHLAAMSALNRRERSVASPPFVSRSPRGSRQSVRVGRTTSRVVGSVSTTGAGSPPGGSSAEILRRPLAEAGGSFA